MKAYISFVLLVIAALIYGCGSSKPVLTEKVKTVKTDSLTTVTITPKIDTVRVGSDVLNMKVPIEEISERPIIQQSLSGRTYGYVSRVKDTLLVDCFVDEYVELIETQNKTIETLKTVVETQNNLQTVTVTETPWWMQIFAYIGMGTCGGFIFLIISKFKIL